MELLLVQNVNGQTLLFCTKYRKFAKYKKQETHYISENNLANPDCDEDKLVFACFKLEDLKGKE